MRGDARLRACANARGRILVASAPATPALMRAEGRHTSARYARDPWACFGSTGRLSDATRRVAPTPASRMKIVTVLGLHGADAAGNVCAMRSMPWSGPQRPSQSAHSHTRSYRARNSGSFSTNQRHRSSDPRPSG
jgi:hypothetical protein